MQLCSSPEPSANSCFVCTCPVIEYATVYYVHVHIIIARTSVHLFSIAMTRMRRNEVGEQQRWVIMKRTKHTSKRRVLSFDHNSQTRTFGEISIGSTDDKGLWDIVSSPNEQKQNSTGRKSCVTWCCCSTKCTIRVIPEWNELFDHEDRHSSFRWCWITFWVRNTCKSYRILDYTPFIFALN